MLLAISLTKIKNTLLSKIDKEDSVEVEKVERYIYLIKLLRRLTDIVDKEGATTVTDNGPQKFTKPHPALVELSKINSQLIALEKTFNFKPIVKEKAKLEVLKNNDDDKRVSLV